MSLKDEEQLVKGARSASTGMTIGGIVAAAAGVASAVLGVLGVFYVFTSEFVPPYPLGS